MIGLVLVTHGNLAKEFISAMQHVVGRQEQVEAVCIGPEDDMEMRRAEILKKVGEEATEIVIAAKNPDPEEIKYEIADFLYHMMVMMVDKGITWDEVLEELSQR